MDDEVFENFHEEALATALQNFDACEVGGGTAQRIQQREKLIAEIQREKQRNMTSNETNRVIVLNDWNDPFIANAFMILVLMPFMISAVYGFN